MKNSNDVIISLITTKMNGTKPVITRGLLVNPYSHFLLHLLTNNSSIFFVIDIIFTFKCHVELF